MLCFVLHLLAVFSPHQGTVAGVQVREHTHDFGRTLQKLGELDRQEQGRSKKDRSLLKPIAWPLDPGLFRFWEQSWGHARMCSTTAEDTDSYKDHRLQIIQNLPGFPTDKPKKSMKMYV